ncbi:MULTISPECIES: undecaprenyldiphospho-muramoylpentapeptide beta-N-acetylglucosaminyltransferase [unclassified Beijerinckia]|uniref:undecaprenyldiphospho-muramoylpentapeptide beta-N-acetylglucosaminyltransferase n=1 Tax=unclassified Beijerinckia TaxID=2638183 RepID=UPI00089D75D3|nr:MULTISPECIES: undecaprenyldiphospho-muramoylpentapeptide beta-N-acetylglucosaminyltransferase [unclassified Beijerinckia]MDH7799596.1 UDP-N-acetylglucosamine--N-acetylmuramyl-(pentapeptide) pyrophosphoryl-undecaprenol N-acetylglucosamine transferase [Beijerinckia sp. GAS462]SEB47441.1 UDP-N-acetylglucosamine-N-acetylmuramylpentapeptide N-acetylglucosamine transferase [Beijerinckia sp. 28-YEA-48]
MASDRAIFVAAGGTGGHLFPAEALSAELTARGYAVELVTDTRALKFGANFPARAIHGVRAATPTGGSLISKASAALQLGLGVIAARSLIGKVKPLCVVGFGGYPTVPPVLAASMLGVPTILHEQNAVMGRANRFMAKRVTRIATGFQSLGGVAPALLAKTVHTGNPVRPAVIAAAQIPFPAADGSLRLLVTGGSQGARVMSDVVPAAIALLPAEQRARLLVTQQARGEDEARVREAYGKLGFAAEVAPFFKDLPERMARSHIIIGRSGASTVSELAVIGRPSILVPFPFALDQDQAANAEHLRATGAAQVVPQPQFTPEWLAEALRSALDDPQGLTRRAQEAKSAGIPDAAARLANLVLETIRAA